MKYQSELIKEIVDKSGHDKSAIHYQSECIEQWIEENKGAYPKLCDYQGEWLYYINENPIGEFPYETITDVTEATVNNVVPYAYRSAILKGNTKYRDIDTGDILDTFDETKNLELVSVKLPVLTTTGKNLFNPYQKIKQGYSINDSGDDEPCDGYATTNYLKILPDTVYTNYYTNHIAFYDENKTFIKRDATWTNLNGAKITSPSNAHYVRIQLEISKIPNGDYSKIGFICGEYDYEPYKSNILTVNEDVTLRGIGDVRDELNCLTGEVVQRVGEIVLDGSDDLAYNYEPNSNDTTTIVHIPIPNTDRIFNFYTDKLAQKYTYDETSVIEGIFADWSGLYIRLLNTKLSSPHSDGVKEYLQSDPVTVQYQLATPTIKTVDLIIQDQDGNTLRKIKPIEGTMHIMTNGTPIKSTATIEIPVEAITQNLMSFVNKEVEE